MRRIGPVYARDGSGGYSLPSNAFSTAVTGGTLVASDANAVWADLVAAMAGSLATDGQSTMSGNLKMGAQKITGLAVGTANTDGLTLGQAQNGTFRWGGVAGGTADALTIAPSPVITAYADGQTFYFVSSASPNTGAATLNVSSVGATALRKNGVALVAGDIAASKVYAATYYNSLFHLWSPFDISGAALLAAANVFTAAQTLSSTAAGTLLFLTSTDAGAGVGPSIDLYRNSGTPAVNDQLGSFNFYGQDAGGAKQIYGAIDTTIIDTTAGSEDANFRIIPTIAGAQVAELQIGNGVLVGTPTGTFKGDGSLNAQAGLYIQGHGTVAQVVSDVELGYITCGTILPFDNTIPQITEGDEVLSVAITPTNASSILRIRITLMLGGAGTLQASGALFVDATANALAAGTTGVTTGVVSNLTIEHEVSAGSTSARTYRVRAGSSVATDAFLNGDNSSRIFGGVAVSAIVVEEILPQ